MVEQRVGDGAAIAAAVGRWRRQSRWRHACGLRGLSLGIGLRYLTGGRGEAHWLSVSGEGIASGERARRQ